MYHFIKWCTKCLIHFRQIDGNRTLTDHSLNQLFGVHRDKACWQWRHLDDLTVFYIATEERLLIWNKAWNICLLNLFPIQCENPETAKQKDAQSLCNRWQGTAFTCLTSSSPCLSNKCKHQCVVKLARRCYPQCPHPLDARKVYGGMLLYTNPITDYPERTLLICTYNMVFYQPLKSMPEVDTVLTSIILTWTSDKLTLSLTLQVHYHHIYNWSEVGECLHCTDIWATLILLHV